MSQQEINPDEFPGGKNLLEAVNKHEGKFTLMSLYLNTEYFDPMYAADVTYCDKAGNPQTFKFKDLKKEEVDIQKGESWLRFINTLEMLTRR